jgi:WD40 repeat protein
MAAQPISITTPSRSFEGHTHTINAVAVFRDGCRMVTSSNDETIRLWDLKGGVELKGVATALLQWP